MIRLSSTIFLLLCLAASAAGQATRTVVLISIGPGDAVYEKFGHNMLWIRDHERKIDLCYNWGLFDFQQKHFVRNFVQGRLDYVMGAADLKESLDEYFQFKRHVVFQRLALTSEQIDDLINRCETNRLPENSRYRYDYFKDNCATRIRDVIDASSGGELKRLIDQQTPAVPMSYRGHSMRLTQDDFFLSMGLDFIYGPYCDRPLSAWEECFLPMRLSRYAEPLAMETWNPWPSDRPAEPETAPSRVLLLGIAGVFLAGLVVMLSQRRNKWASMVSTAIVCGWWLINGFGGVLLAYMWLFTDHIATYENQNMLSYTPLAWIALVLLPLARHRVRYRRPLLILTGLMACISIAALLLHGSVLRQGNLHFTILAVCLHTAGFLFVRRLTPSASVGEVSVV
ncbi:MAG: DUF4105 domain-containing protein [Burkholderiales bacterium]|nr:DUF4105 domain-containing protein [Phycisphaerae bacterium]